jgi:hypothetical protein
MRLRRACGYLNARKSRNMPAYIQNQPSGQKPNPQLKIGGGEGAVPVLSSPELGFVLDRSSSMESLKTEAVTGFNSLCDEQRKIEPPASFSFATFSNDVSFLYDGTPLTVVPPLTPTLYEPYGGTALNDGIGQMIQRIGKRAKRSARVLIAILTDGGENSSRNFSQADILSMITYRRTTYDWQFVFIGPEDALSYALSIGIPKSNVVSFDTDPAGMKLIMDRLSKSMRAYQLGDRKYALKLRN